MTQISSNAFSTAWPMTFARGRNGDVYGVNGEDRGMRWDTVTASVERLGIAAPAAKPTVTVTAGAGKLDVVGIQVVDPGQGYASLPTLTFSAGGTSAPVAKPRLGRGAVSGFSMRKYGNGYSAAPEVTVANPDSTSAGSGATLAVVTSSYVATLPGGSLVTRYVVTGVTVTAGGSKYKGSPRVVFSGAGSGGTVATAIVSNGAIASVAVSHSGVWDSVPTATIVPDPALENRKAAAEATCQPAIQGKYWFALRYIDDTAKELGGPIPSSISELAELEVNTAGAGFSWTWSNTGIEARVNKIELWRTTGDQALVLYKVAEVANNATSYADTLSDTELASPARNGFAALPITLPNGQVNARRFTPPPQNKRVIAMFQDRAWYGVDVPGKKYNGTSGGVGEPNALYFSEADEPESVPETNQIIIQENVKGQDRVTALMPFGGGMVVFQERHAYRLSFVSQPLIDANITLIGQRGCLNQRCFDVFDNVAYVVDSMGMYVLDGTQSLPISDPVETFWSDNIIHWPSAKWFFVRVDPASRIVRFFFSIAAGFPDRALCFHPVTKGWWLELYGQTFAAAECMVSGGRQTLVAGARTGAIVRFDAGGTDLTVSGTQGIACQIRTGNMSLAPQQTDRAIRVLYDPTTADCPLSLALHYNNSATARPAAVATDRGGSFTTTGGSAAALNMKLTRSALGDATGYAICHYSGRVDERSVGADRHIAVDLSLTRPTAETATVYGMAIQGVAP